MPFTPSVATASTPVEALKYAQDFVRRQYIEGFTLDELRLVLNAHFKQFESADGDRGWGFEGWSAMYQYDLGPTLRSSDEPVEEVKLSGTVRLRDVRYRWISVFAVTGGNEGHYVHIDLIDQRERVEHRIPLLLTKTFNGHESAIQIAAEASRVLGV